MSYYSRGLKSITSASDGYERLQSVLELLREADSAPPIIKEVDKSEALRMRLEGRIIDLEDQLREAKGERNRAERERERVEARAEREAVKWTFRREDIRADRIDMILNAGTTFLQKLDDTLCDKMTTLDHRLRGFHTTAHCRAALHIGYSERHFMESLTLPIDTLDASCKPVKIV